MEEYLFFLDFLMLLEQEDSILMIKSKYRIIKYKILFDFVQSQEDDCFNDPYAKIDLI